MGISMYKRKSYKNRRRVEKYINGFLCLILVFGILPVFLTTFFGRLRLEELLFSDTEMDEKQIEVLKPEVLAKQISIHMPKEVIKAQSVIARTQIMAAEKNGETQPAAFSTERLQELWGDEFEAYYEQLKELIAETKGETLQYNGNYIYAAYHQVSAGNTRDMKEYYENSTMPYLCCTNCHEDTQAEGYLNVYFWENADFIELCAEVFPEAAGAWDIQITKRDSAGYVLEVQIGQTIYEGEAFRKKLNLPSACFEITFFEDSVRIVTMGQGHGFGLSQNMAKKLADEGKTYREILEYFYKGVEIK